MIVCANIGTVGGTEVAARAVKEACAAAIMEEAESNNVVAATTELSDAGMVENVAENCQTVLKTCHLQQPDKVSLGHLVSGVWFLPRKPD